MTESERVDNNVSSTGLRRNFGSVGVGARYAPSAWLGHWQSASSRSLHDDRVLPLLKTFAVPILMACTNAIRALAATRRSQRAASCVCVCVMDWSAVDWQQEA